ncbi:hypothetical protein ACFL2Q_10960 [Thermodesulfobacteriota bacterium]
MKIRFLDAQADGHDPSSRRKSVSRFGLVALSLDTGFRRYDVPTNLEIFR